MSTKVGWTDGFLVLALGMPICNTIYIVIHNICILSRIDIANKNIGLLVHMQVYTNLDIAILVGGLEHVSIHWE